MNSVFYESVNSLLTIGDTILIKKNQALWFPDNTEDLENFPGTKGIIIQLQSSYFSIIEINVTKKNGKLEKIRNLDVAFKPFHTRVVLVEKTYKPHY